MIEEAEYIVRVTLTNVVTFSAIERETPITAQDAIVNAYGSMPDEFWEALKAEGWGLAARAEKIAP